MVIRSLVPGGSAERHGGLLPGDQLVSVNQTKVDLLTLAQSVELLKSVPAGTVRLGLRKPLVRHPHLLVSHTEKLETDPFNQLLVSDVKTLLVQVQVEAPGRRSEDGSQRSLHSTQLPVPKVTHTHTHIYIVPLMTKCVL